MADLGFTFSNQGAIMSSNIIIPEGLPLDPMTETWVTIVTGNRNDLKYAGGHFPSVALWDDEGKRLGQHYAKWDEKVSQGSSKTVFIKHDQDAKPDANPHYVMLSNENDAICIAMIQVSNGRLAAALFGDTAQRCGQSWYYSDRLIRGNTLSSKCVWLDGDKSNGINARAMSFHVNDMLPSEDKMNMYEKDNYKYLCTSTPRFSIWENLLADGVPPFFDPPLKYNKDSYTGKEGADKNPDRALDNDKEPYDKGVYLTQGEPERNYRRSNRPSRFSKRQGANIDSEHLVVTELSGQTAEEVCSHPNSVGYDIVSYVDMKFCDLSKRTLYDICSDSITSNCFDANSTTIVGGINARGEFDGSKKKYKTRSHWK